VVAPWPLVVSEPILSPAGLCKFAPDDKSSARQYAAFFDGGVPCASIAISKTSVAFEVTSKRRKSFPSETRVKRGRRFVHGDVELIEKLGRNDLCPCGSGRRFQSVLHGWRPLRRRQSQRLLSGSEHRAPGQWARRFTPSPRRGGWGVRRFRIAQPEPPHPTFSPTGRRCERRCVPDRQCVSWRFNAHPQTRRARPALIRTLNVFLDLGVRTQRAAPQLKDLR
jgi:SEC-C motif